MSNETFFRRLDEYLPDQAPPTWKIPAPSSGLRENLFFWPG